MWKDRLHKLFGRLHVDGRDISVFLMSLFLAFSIWLIHNLSLNYSDTVSVPVVAQCNIEGHSNISSNSCMIAARCRTSGFSLLRIRQQGKRKALTIRFDSKDLHHKEGEQFYITAAELSDYVTAIFGDGVRLESFLSESVQFRFPFENNKRVPVQAVHRQGLHPYDRAFEPEGQRSRCGEDRACQRREDVRDRGELFLGRDPVCRGQHRGVCRSEESSGWQETLYLSVHRQSGVQMLFSPVKGSYRRCPVLH